MTDSVKRAWERFLDPDVMRPTLIAASLYLSSFEVLKGTIVDRIRDFFTNGFADGKDIVDSEYQTVLALDRSPVFASLMWLRSSGAIQEPDIEAFRRIKALRNRLAHEMRVIVGREGLPPEFADRFQELLALLRKIEVWWILEVEIPTSPDPSAWPDPDDVTPGSLLMLQAMWRIALGDEAESRELLVRFRDQQGGHWA